MLVWVYFDQTSKVIRRVYLIEALSVLSPRLEGNTEKLKNPYNPSELKIAIWVIARLAGWSGYQKQIPP